MPGDPYLYLRHERSSCSRLVSAEVIRQEVEQTTTSKKRLETGKRPMEDKKKVGR